MLVLDVDGVLTDGTIVVDSQGRESKSFSIIDGHGIKMWKRAGLAVAFLSGRESAPTKQQAKELAVDFCLEGCIDKYACMLELMQTSGVSAGQIAYVGDDLPDLPVIRCVGFAAAVANAVDEVKRAADYVTKRKGGEGAVREVIEYILKKTGRWNGLVKRYMADPPFGEPQASRPSSRGVSPSADSPRQHGTRPVRKNRNTELSNKSQISNGAGRQKKQSVTPGKSEK
ncbi:MAG: HAD hydrolase family protein [Chloroflexi bacterium]|nr:HAD hydrolase family protein [Chloroflexota bacterium]